MSDDYESIVDEPTEVELDEYARDLVSQLALARRAAKSWSEAEQKARDQIAAWLALKDADVGLVDGEPAVKRTVSTTHRLDSKALKEAEPFLYEAYVRPKQITTIRLMGNR